MKLNILPNPASCAGVAGGVNSVITDHAAGFLAAGCEINNGDGVNIVHALAEREQIDVFHCHGLYPIGNGMFDAAYSKANDILLRNALRAKVTICISEFSANILRHKLHIDPIVTRNGIWTKDYQYGGSQTGAVLFPKSNLDANARADDAIWLRDNSDFPLLSVAKIDGIKSTGSLSRADFTAMLSQCSIYLGTTKENNSMATMEAMISGVPVVGYDIGFNSEWLISGTGCELVPKGDRRALKDAIIRVRADWKRYSKAAREYAAIFDWQPVIDELLGIYSRVGEAKEDRSVSVVIPCHNYARYLPEAIQSALAQTVPCEVIVVDDKSTDNSVEIAKQFAGVTVIENETNLGVAETRNLGIKKAKGAFIVCLDADDRLKTDFVEKHLAAFKTSEQAISHAPIEIIDSDGKSKNQRMFRNAAKPELHAKGQNQIPSCCMFRKSFWLRAGGYDKRYTPAEDANLWLKILAVGGVLVRASNEPMMEYRTHDKSLSGNGIFPNWHSDYKDLFNAPIVERDADITIHIEGNEKVKETLWQLESQNYKNWTAAIKAPNGLTQIFPWLNKHPSSQASVLKIQSGTPLPQDFLMQFKNQPPPWTIESRFQSP